MLLLTWLLFCSLPVISPFNFCRFEKIIQGDFSEKEPKNAKPRYRNCITLFAYSLGLAPNRAEKAEARGFEVEMERSLREAL